VKNDKWIKRWKIPKSSGDGFWTLAIDKNGNYGCSCPRWIFKREECHHILLIKQNRGEEIINKSKPKYILAKVLKPIYKEKENELWVPLIEIPDARMMGATICYYLLKYGYSMSEIREIRHIPNQWTAKAIMNNIEKHGEACYPEDYYSFRYAFGR
jgi:hypothetical protein